MELPLAELPLQAVSEPVAELPLAELALRAVSEPVMLETVHDKMQIKAGENKYWMSQGGKVTEEYTALRKKHMDLIGRGVAMKVAPQRLIEGVYEPPKYRSNQNPQKVGTDPPGNHQPYRNPPSSTPIQNKLFGGKGSPGINVHTRFKNILYFE